MSPQDNGALKPKANMLSQSNKNLFVSAFKLCEDKVQDEELISLSRAHRINF